MTVLTFAGSGAVLAGLITMTAPPKTTRPQTTSAPIPSEEPHAPPSPARRPTSSVSSRSEQRWWIRVGLLERQPLHQIALGQGVVCQLRRGSQQRLSSAEINAGLRAGNLPPLSCRGGWVHLNGIGYWGLVEIERLGQEWLAIHTVDLERYVASVVGAEMPSSWNPQALMAQAVAARSYALTHLIRPASPRFHLGDSTRWQAYRGASSRTAASRQATQSTRGIILSKDQDVVESLYAATRAIADDAHRHLGASMSQTDANALGERGLTYPEILAHFYPGTQLKALRRHDD